MGDRAVPGVDKFEDEPRSRKKMPPPDELGQGAYMAPDGKDIICGCALVSVPSAWLHSD